MPFGPIRSPHLGMSLIKAAAEKEGFRTNLFYFNLRILKDSRPCSKQTSYILTDEEKYIYEICETIRRYDDIFAEAKAKYPNLKQENVQMILEDLNHKNFLIRDKGKYLALAVRPNLN